MAEYLHGAYGYLDDSIVQKVVTSETIPVYFGTAPVNLVRGREGVVNEPIEINSLADAKKKIGYSDDFANYTLCEAVAAHFDREDTGVGPIYVINVLDPEVHVKSEKTEVQAVFAKKKATIVSDTIDLDTVTVAATDGTEYEEGTDYSLTYSYISSGGRLVISSKTIPNGAAVVTYSEVDPEAVTYEDVIGLATDEGEYSGICALPLVFLNLFVVPNLLAAPGWSHIPDVYNALIEQAKNVNGHWDAMVAADLPLVDSESNAVDTIAKAISWKDENSYDEERAIVCWPMCVDKDSRRFHVSTLFVATAQEMDQEHGGVPFESPSNKAVAAVKQFFGDNSTNRGFDQQTGNGLNEHGITTIIPWAGEWVLWGDHTAAYEFGSETVDARAIFHTNMRMLLHITNSFQQEWSPEIDQPMTKALKDRIVNREQEKLDGYVTIGALLGKPTVQFIESENSTADMMNGDFVWNIEATPTPPLKSATVYVAYTDAGFSVYFEEDGE